MKQYLAFAPILALALALSSGAASASDYYVTDDGGYVYDTSNDWYTTAPSDTYGYYDPNYSYVTPDTYYNDWYGYGPNVGIGINIGGDRDRDYWRHSHFDGDRGGSGFRGSASTGFRSGNVNVRASGGARTGGGSRSSAHERR